MHFAIKKIESSIPVNIAARFEREHRAQQFFSSRLALSACLEKAGLTPPTSLLELEIIDHKYLKKWPELILSISHTKEFGAAAIINKKDHQSIGIDIEKKNRIIKVETTKLFVNDQDDQLPLLELWCKKEAAFKATSPFYQENKTLVLKDIVISNNHFLLLQNPNIRGKVEIKDNEYDLLCAVATI